MAAAICAFIISDPLRRQITRATWARAAFLRGRIDVSVSSTPARDAGPGVWTSLLVSRQIGAMRPRASRSDALQSVTVLEALEGLAAQHGAAGVPFMELKAAARSG